jgi:hypothetical protein
VTDKIPVGVAVCCREWIVSLAGPWGRCGLCNEKPVYKDMLPEDEWPTPPPQIIPEELR